jgi:chromosome segregation ATPase
LRQETRSLKESYARALTAINLKEEEIVILRNHLEKKNQSHQALVEENRMIRQRLDDVLHIRDQVEILRNEKDRFGKEIREYEELLSNKTNNLRNTMTKLEAVEQEMFDTTTNLKSLQVERDDLLSENTQIKKRLHDLEENDRILRIQCDEKEEKVGRLIKEGDKLQKQVLQLTKDLENLCSEQHQIQNERGFLKFNQEKDQKIIEKSVEVCYQTLNRLNETLDGLARTAGNSSEINLFSKMFRELLEKHDFTQFVDEKELFLPQMMDYLGRATKIILDEINVDQYILFYFRVWPTESLT